MSPFLKLVLGSTVRKLSSVIQVADKNHGFVQRDLSGFSSVVIAVQYLYPVVNAR